MEDQRLSTLPPLFYGRLARILAGVGTLGSLFFIGPLGPWAFWGLVCLGLSFLIAGIFAVPGCEITAIPNLFLSAKRQIHCLCPVFTPLDKVEHSWHERAESKSTAE